MIARTHAAYLEGTRASPLTVEAELSAVDELSLHGLDDFTARECRLRVRAGFHASGLPLPRGAAVRVLPDGHRRATAYLDLAIAVALVALCAPEIDRRVNQALLVGELSLDGQLRRVRGLLPFLLRAREGGLRCAVVPRAQLREARLVGGIDAYGAETLAEAVAFLRGQGELPRAVDLKADRRRAPDSALSPVPEELRRALAVAAAGRHSVLLLGPYGSGKVTAARRVPALFPALEPSEALEIATHHSAAGLDIKDPVTRPFRAPHHTASLAGILGGGDPVRPGEVVLAHRGVLLLDEVPEFARTVLDEVFEADRRGSVMIPRRGERVSMETQPLVIAAMQLCPCGRRGTIRSDCRCSRAAIVRYFERARLDRFDMHLVIGDGYPLVSVPRDDLRLHRVAQTIADLGSGVVTAAEINEARRYRLA